MSLITRCPACGTMFKVVPDQLRISEGWVRCGHCAEVFDATAYLQGEEARATQPGDLAPRHEEPVQALSPRSEHPAAEEFTSSLHTEVGEEISSEPPDSGELREEAKVLTEGPLDRPFVLQRQELPAAPPEPVVTDPAPLEREPDLHDLAFVRQARRQEFWSSTTMRVVLFLSFIVLASLLALQMALHDRDRLAATDPSLRPWLMKLCEPLNCIVRPPRQIDAVAIDSSSFNKLRGDTFRLNVTLKNQAATEVAMPALELTLTDAQDQAVVRRVLLPGDIEKQPGIIGAGSEWSGAVAMAVAANGGSPRIAGYRLLAFYP